MRAALFLDRDGVLVRERHLLTRAEDVELESGAARAVALAQRAGIAVVVVTNQTVVSRGLSSEADVARIHERMLGLLRAEGCAPLDGIYVCPHHPHAEVEAYRLECECRKPKPGMLLRASRELEIDLRASAMVGDRVSDVIAGRRAGCKTILVTSGAHDAPPIVGVEAGDRSEPDVVCASLEAAMPHMPWERGA